jgi:adenylate cyclase
MLYNVRTTRQQRLRAAFFLACALGTIGIVSFAYGLGFFNDFERQSVDARFAIRGNQGPPPGLAVVKIDDVTFSDLNTQWPFPRSYHAKVIDRLAADGAKEIAYDIQFSEYSDPAQDNALYLALKRFPGRIVLATTETDNHGNPNLIFKQDMKALHAHAGSANFVTDKGNVYRKFPYEVGGLKSFAVVSAELALGHLIERSKLGEGGQAWIDYAGPHDTVSSASFSRVLRGQVEPGFFRNKIVVVGPVAPSLQDIHATPTDSRMSGAEIEANAINTALHGFPLQSASTTVNVLLIVLLGLIAPLLGLRWGPVIGTAVAIGAAGLFVLSTQLAFDRGLILSFVYPLASLTLATVGGLGVHLTVTAFERERVRDMFSRFVPEGVVDQVLARTDADLRLGGRQMDVTVMFSDLRGFTSSVENMSAPAVIEVLNHYLGEMSDAILDHGGTLVSYMGDGIMAVFGAPIEQEDQADRALAAAEEMLNVRLPLFNEWMRERGLGEGYRMGIGLNRGAVMVGNVGHERRLEYTAVGDTVNTSSRIEGMTKGTPYPVLVAQSVYEQLSSPPADLVYVDEMEVRGREQKIKLWGLEPEPSPAVAPEPSVDAGPVEAPAQAEPA